MHRCLSRLLSVEVRDSANYFNHPLSYSDPCTKNEQNVKETLQKHEHVFLQSKASFSHWNKSYLIFYFEVLLTSMKIVYTFLLLSWA